MSASPRHQGPSNRRPQGRPASPVPATHLSPRVAQVTRRTQARNGGSAAAPRQKSRGPVPYIFGMVLAVAVLGVFAVTMLPRIMSAIQRSDSATTAAAGSQITVTIPDGASGQDIFRILVNAGLISNSQSGDFLSAVRSHGDKAALQAGTYTFIAGSSVKDIVDALVAGPGASYAYKLTVPEGYTVEGTAAAVNKAIPSISKEDFVAQAKASNYAGDYPFLSEAVDDSLEGFLFPKTYAFDSDVTADKVIRTMLSQYQTEVASLDFAGAAKRIRQTYGVDMKPYDFLKLASVIEREAGDDDQRTRIASVFYNRMKSGMPLQSDATTAYVTGKEVTPEDLKKPSPYNTYLNKGLPPTPICSPGLESIKAAMDPADTKYYYFYNIVKDGKSVCEFSESYDEHLASIASSRTE